MSIVVAGCFEGAFQFVLSMEELERWADIEDYEGLYQVGNMGSVGSLKKMVKGKVGLRTAKERILKPKLVGSDYRKYYSVALYKNGKKKFKLIHRIVAQHFVPNPDNKPYVNHIDNNPLNNHYTNLEWVTGRENVNHGWMFHKTSSNYPGVNWNKESKKWRVRMIINGKQIHLGYFTCELEAAEAYQNALKQLGEITINA